MNFTVANFRTAFPEFADSTVYADATITLWAGFAQVQVRQCIWKTQWLMGVYLYTAHEITISKQDLTAAKIGGTPGVSGGIANTKTVGQATVGYDSTTTTEKDGGYWNRTTYGIQFLRLARIFGAGSIQL